MPRTGKPRLRLSVGDSRLVDQIIERCVREGLIEDTLDDRIEVRLLLSLCHLNGCPLKLDAMATWPRTFDIAHDIGGLRRHLNTGNGQLLNLFLPRFAREQ